jgi:glycosyltransferase involved in cell wall biosynthesis
MNVLALTRFTRLGAGPRLRTLQYIPYLERHGIHFDVSPFFPDEAITDLEQGKRRRASMVAGSVIRRIRALCSVNRYDAIWLEAECIPLAPWLFERAFLSWAPPVIVDYDDAVFHNYEKFTQPLLRPLLADKIESVMAFAAVVVAGNSYIGDRARQAGAKRVEIVPTVLEPERYPVPDRRGRETLTIGWIGSPSTAPYLLETAAALHAVQRQFGVKVVVMGSGRFAIPDVDLHILKWSEAAETAAAASFDIGIMPLPDQQWTRGKCGYKLLQYMASGLPVVASPVGVNPVIVTEGKTGFLASGTDDWKTALTALLSDAQLRQSMGAAGRARVLADYSVEATAPKLAAIIKSTAASAV